ncbi:TetR/AcrR family transcriptional regulator [Streptomyces sp. S.PB5]|uniref:TetR/AcrR family transcriptional regulator n=1 Tax=Streptomyces sp. S.PB5 TaxID=3020844 RepID=UPI0025B16FB5|nr:TetR/AcrR family transcriptional regulator [Streptomyces sp. S.PB5]MDN3027934.1 TetR/AcrR family transcriptional regulator [Streptomyces sp. S.PB5]
MRAAVLAAAVDELLDGGLEAFSIGQVARRAGVHETSIYRRWGTRAALALDAVLDRTDAEIPVPDTGSLRTDLSALLHDAAAFVRTPLGELLVRMALREDMAEYEDARERFWNHRFAAGAAVLDRAEHRGELRPGIDRRLAFEALTGPLHMRLLLTREPVDDAFLESVVDLVLGGMARDAHPGTGAGPVAAGRS